MTRCNAAGDRIEVLFQGPEQQVLQSIIFERDSAGRLVKEEVRRMEERVTRMGLLGETRTTFRYDDHGNLSHQSNQEIQREMLVEEDGRMDPVKGNSYRQETKIKIPF